MLILSEYWTPKTVVNNPSEFNIHMKVESKPKAINIPCLKKQIVGAGSLGIQTCKTYWELVTSNFELKFLLNFLDIWKKVIKKETSDLDKRKKYEKSHKLAGKSVSRKKRWKGSVLVVLAQNLFYNWKFQFKISVKTSAKARVLLSLFFQFFLLYSRAILSFSLSPSLLLCPFHCFNCWIILEKLSC